MRTSRGCGDLVDRRLVIATFVEEVESGAFDAAMTMFSVHQWRDLDAGLKELRRVTQGPVVILTCDPRRLDRFWLNDYAPEVIATEARRYPSVDRLVAGLGGTVEPEQPASVRVPIHPQAAPHIVRRRDRQHMVDHTDPVEPGDHRHPHRGVVVGRLP